MFSDNKQKNITRAKWIIGTVSACILIYLGIRYIGVLADSLCWLINLILPILIGVFFSLILDIPLQYFEKNFFTKKLHLKSQTTKRYLSILLSFVLKAFIFVIFLVILQQIEGNVIYPKVVGNRINLPSFWVLAGLTIGGNLAGPIGMILGVPICSALYNLINEATDWKEQYILENSKTVENEVISNEK